MEQELEATLLACCTPNTQTIRLAEQALQKQLRGKSCVIVLVNLVSLSTHVSVRQLSAVLLRVKLSIHWMKLSPTEQNFCKQKLLEALFKETVRAVRLCICYTIATLGKFQLVAGVQGWPELLQVIQSSTTDQNSSENRELGFLLLYTLTETLGTSLKSSLPALAGTFTTALTTEKDDRVLAAILKASVALIEYLEEDDEVLMFQPVLSCLVKILLQEEKFSEIGVNSIASIMELISDLSESPIPILDPLIQDCCIILSRFTVSKYPESIRGAATTALSCILVAKPRFIFKNHLACSTILEACLNLCRDAAAAGFQEPDISGGGEDDDEEEDEEEMSLLHMTELLVSSYAENLPTKVVVETLLNSAAGMVQNEANQIDREAGLIALIIASEGIASDIVESHANAFDHLQEMVFNCIIATNQSVGVVRHALLLLAQWTDHLWALMEDKAKFILPACIRLTTTSHPLIFPAACAVIQGYAESMEEDEFSPYVDEVCMTILSLFDENRKRTPILVQNAIQTLSIVSISSGARFAKYFDKSLSVTTPLLNLSGEQFHEVRAHATAFMGQLAIASKQCTPKGMVNPFLALVPELLLKWFEFLEQEDHDLDFRDAIHHSFVNIIQTIGVDIEPFLPKMIELLLIHSVSDDGDVVRKAIDRDNGVGKISQSLMDIAVEEEGSEGDDDEEDDGKQITHVRAAAVESKTSAFTTFEMLFETYAQTDSTNFDLKNSELSRRLVDIIEICSNTYDTYLHPKVRAEAISALGASINFAYRVELGDIKPTNEMLSLYAQSTFKDADFKSKWIPGQIIATAPTTAQLFQEIVLPYILEAMSCDRSKIVCAKACEVLNSIITLTGCTLILSEAKEISETLLSLLQGEARCQRDGERMDQGNDEEGEDNEDDEGRRHDEILLDCVIECLVIFAKALGRENFSQYFSSIGASLMRRSKPKMPIRDRIAASGCLAVLISIIKQNSIGPKLIKLALDITRQDEDDCLKRNGLVLCASLMDIRDSNVNVTQFLQVLQPILKQVKNDNNNNNQRKFEMEDDLAVLDNACSLVCRILLLVSDDRMFFQILRELLPLLPLKFDHEEDWFVFHCLCTVAERAMKDLEAFNLFVPICSISLAENLSEEHKEDDNKGSLATLIRLSEIVFSKVQVPNELIQQLNLAKEKLGKM